MYKNKNIQKLADELDILQVIGEYVVLKKAGSNYKGLSPFKEENTPSFVVSPTKNIFKDFSTGIGGDAITFYQKINNISFMEAVEELSIKYNISLDNLQTMKTKINENSKYFEIMREAQNYFQNCILNSSDATEYMKKRGYNSEEIRKFGIGFSDNKWDGLYKYLKSKNYDENDLNKLGLIKTTNNNQVYDYFRNRIIFPIYNDSMKIVAFGGRIIESSLENAKYLNSPDSIIFKKGNELFGLYNRGENIRKKGLAILMEGYLDVLTAHKYGFNNSVASLGTAFTEEQAKLLKKYTQNIIIAYDNDEAGKNAIIKAGNILKKYDFNIKCLSLESECKDPDEFLQKYGKKEFLEKLKKSKDMFEFLYEHYIRDLNIKEYIGREKLIDRLKTFLLNVNSQIEFNSYIEKLSVNINVDKKILEKYFIKNNKKYYKKDNEFEKISILNKKNSENKYDELEKETLIFLLHYSESLNNEHILHCNYFKNKVMTNVIYKDIFNKLKEMDFKMDRLDEFEEEEKEIVTTLKLNSNIDPKSEEKLYKYIFTGWFSREIKEIKDMLNKKDPLNLKLKSIESDIVQFHKIEDIEMLYRNFKSEVIDSVRD